MKPEARSAIDEARRAYSLSHAWRSCVMGLAALLLVGAAQDTRVTSGTTGRERFEALCSSCHGGDGRGGELGPDISHGVRDRSIEDLRDLIVNGIPAGGMPGSAREDPLLGELAAYVRSLVAPAADNPTAGDVAAGERFFSGRGDCSSCHRVRGRGGLAGPDLSEIALKLTRAEIEQSLAEPGSRIAPGYRMVTVRLRDGRSLRGFARNESNYDLQLQDLDGRFHLLVKDDYVEVLRDDGSSMPPVKGSESELRDLMAYLTRLTTSEAPDFRGPSWTPATDGGLPFADIAEPRPGDWPTYHGKLSGNRHSGLDQIRRDNVAGLQMQWLFPIRGTARLQVTPVVVDGVMYVTAANQAYALDAATGRLIWHFDRPRTPGLVGDASAGINRGVAVLGDRVFMVTDHAHLIALHTLSGSLLWDVAMDDYRRHYGATSAPLVVKDRVISGVSGGDEGVRGFLAAYRASTGEEVWRFWTIPEPGEPLSETWGGRALEHGCGSTWLTGTYDADADLLFWTVGNPCPDFNGDERQGDNLYTASVLALDPDDGSLRWYYQFTPHDVHDWDAQQSATLIDAPFGGRERKLLVQANRNGFFYVLDRLTGELLLAKPFVEKLTWARGIGADGRPELLPGTAPSVEGVEVCPAIEGATNWMSTAYHPDTGLYYVMALEKCNVYTKSSAWWEPGQSFYGGAAREIPGEPGQKFLRAIDVQTGEIAWEVAQEGPADTWGGVLSTAGGLVFFGDDSGAFAAADARTGEPLWHFHTNQRWKASPMTYAVAGRQFVAVAAGSNILAFALP